MKWSHIPRQRIHYGLTPSAFSGLAVVLIIAMAMGLSWLIWTIAIWTGF